jgi:hypothetical protein
VPADAEVICLSSDDEDDERKAGEAMGRSGSTVAAKLRETVATLTTPALVSDNAASVVAVPGEKRRLPGDMQESDVMDEVEAKLRRRELQLLAAERRARNPATTSSS